MTGKIEGNSTWAQPEKLVRSNPHHNKFHEALHTAHDRKRWKDIDIAHTQAARKRCEEEEFLEVVFICRYLNVVKALYPILCSVANL